LIGSYEKVELAFCQTQEFTVLDPFPTTLAYGYALVVGKDIAHWYGQTFVQQDSHPLRFG
jgi:hypothetical protein